MLPTFRRRRSPRRARPMPPGRPAGSAADLALEGRTLLASSPALLAAAWPGPPTMALPPAGMAPPTTPAGLGSGAVGPGALAPLNLYLASTTLLVPPGSAQSPPLWSAVGPAPDRGQPAGQPPAGPVAGSASHPTPPSQPSQPQPLGPALPPSAATPPPPTPVGQSVPPMPANRPILSDAVVVVGGRPTRELAVADPAAGGVSVLVGSSVVFRVDGLSNPQAVKLDDINNDGTPDLIVADTGHDRVLVYLGFAGGGFDSEPVGGAGFAVGSDPAGLTLGDVNDDGRADLVVANEGSDNISVLLGTGTGSSWTLIRGRDVRAGDAPVRTVLIRPDPDSASPLPCLAILNRGSADVTIYRPDPEGQFAAEPAKTLAVGSTPFAMMAGDFGRHHNDVGLVTLDEKSNSVTILRNLFSDSPVRQDLYAGSSPLLSAFSLTADASGVSDLMVASMDGSVSYLQLGTVGYQLVNLIPGSSTGGISAITGGTSLDGGFDLIEASTVDNSIAILHLEPVPASTAEGPAAAVPAAAAAGGLASMADEQDETRVELIPGGTGLLDLVGVLWSGAGRSTAGATSGGVAASRPAGQGGPVAVAVAGGDPVLAASRSEDADELGPGEAPPSWADYVLGLDAAFEAVHDELAAADREDWDDPAGRPGLLTFGSPGFAPTGGDGFAGWARAADDATRPAVRPGPVRIEPRISSVESADLGTAAVGSAVAVRLLVNASPPKPPRPRAARRRGRPFAWPETLPPTDPHG